MNERKEYASFSIPPRGISPAGYDSPSPRLTPGNEVSITDAAFAEIEYELGIADNSNKWSQLSFIPPTVPARAPNPLTDPIRQKFKEMRDLAPGGFYARYDAGLFYKQARFMEDYTDNYSGGTPFFMYYPNYQQMGYEQLRTYFTWRAKVRKGGYAPASVSYIFLYIYELLSIVGVSSPSEGLDKLMDIWIGCRENEPSIEKYLPGWLKDYHIYYELPVSFSDFVHKNNLQNYYLEQFLFNAGAKNSLALWNGISNYDVTKSGFYNSGNETLLRDCFYAVVSGVRDLCLDLKIRLADLPIYSVCNGVSWYPFQRAIFYQSKEQGERTVELPGGETYRYKNGRWTADIFIHDTGRKEFAGYLIKKTESCLRQALKYKYKITVDSGAVYQSVQKLKELGIPFARLDKEIEKLTADFYRDINRVVVNVDHGNLARIRQESLGTQDSLIVPEDDITLAAVPMEQEPIREQPCGLPLPVTDGWATLKSALSITELTALSIALSGNTGIKAFADDNNVMLEVLADNINEKAFDFIGDSILEIDGGIAIYDEYRDKIAEMVG